MILASIESDGNALQVRRSNGPYLADIRAYATLWCGLVAFFCAIDLASEAFIWTSRSAGGTPVSPFLSLPQLLLFAALMAAAVLFNLMPVFVGLRSPQMFTFDVGRNAFLVEGRNVGQLDHLRLILQNSLGPSRRAFRIVARCVGQDYVLAHTQRFTAATFSGKEYPSTVTQAGLQRRYWYNRWADYKGSKTGFDPAWPEYRELFALYEQLTNYMEASKTRIPAG